jgi:hypothetical protein
MHTRKRYLFLNLQTYFSEFYFFGLQNFYIKRRFLYLLNYTEKSTIFFFKTQKTSINFLKYYLNFIYLFLVFLEIRYVNAYIYYITGFAMKHLTLKHKHFAGYYNNAFGNFEGLSNRLMFYRMVNFCIIENLIFAKSGMILNFSGFFHTKSALRFFRNTDNIVGSLDFSNYVDYVMFNNLTLNSISERFMYSFFHEYAFYHNFNYPLQKLLINTIISENQKARIITMYNKKKDKKFIQNYKV